MPRFAVGKGRRVNADGEFVEEEGLLELADVDPGTLAATDNCSVCVHLYGHKTIGAIVYYVV